MFEVINRRTRARTALQLLELIFHMTVRKASGNSRNPAIALLTEMLQNIAMMAGFFLLMSAFGMGRTAPIRGDFMLFLISGIMLFMTHIKTIGAVAGSSAPGQGMMTHAPMTTIVEIASNALAALYMQFLTLACILGMYQLATHKVHIEDPIGAIAMFLLAWFSGACFGIVMYDFTQAAPKLAPTFTMIYRRMNMVFSGKMSPANALPAAMLPMFAWNPLFHIIDQARGYIFLNYTAYRTSIEYPLIACGIALVIGLLGEFYHRRAMRVAHGE